MQLYGRLRGMGVGGIFPIVMLTLRVLSADRRTRGKKPFSTVDHTIISFHCFFSLDAWILFDFLLPSFDP